MTWTEMAEHWHLLGVQAKSKWPKLSDVDLAFVGGNRDRLIAKLEKRYGLSADDGEQHVDEWLQYEALPRK
jgi:uncharacterized protein YjbJ (UPF0337 family)